MKKRETFEDFVRNYLENEVISKTKESYSSWVRKNGTDTRAAYKNDVLAALSEHSRRSSGYGKRAEDISDMGLSASGYSDYINKRADSDLDDALVAAKRKSFETEEKSMKKYEKKALDIDEVNRGKRKTVLDQLEERRVIDFERAYKYALDSGLDEKNSEIVAGAAVYYSRIRLKEDVLNMIVTEKLSQSQTRSYAEGLGLNKDEIDELCKKAKAINETIRSNRYAQYVKDQIEKEQK